MQLQMLWSPEGAYRLDRAGAQDAAGAHGPALVARVIGELAPGYRLRTYLDTDREGYIDLMRNGGFETWNEEHLAGVLRTALPDGIFFVEHEASGELVSTATAHHRPTDRYAFGGELGWVATRPEHRGKRLGKIASAASLRRFLSAGYTTVYLSTDDWRLAAVKIYLDLGFRPVLYLREMEERWQLVCGALGIDPASLVYERTEVPS